MLRWLAGLVLALLVLFGAMFWEAGRAAPPQITIQQPTRIVGQTGSVDVIVEAPGGRLTSLTMSLEQNGRTIPLFSLEGQQSATVTQIDRDHIRVSRPVGGQSVPELRQGAARVTVAASRQSFLNLRTLSSSAARDFQVRLEPPRIAIVSTHHYVNHGGSEMVVYRATPPDVASGVRVGDIEYPGFPIRGVRLEPDTTAAEDRGAGPAGVELKVAFFALLHDQDLNTRIVAFARDEADNQATASFIDNVFEKPFKRSRLEVDDSYMKRVVPEIIQHSPELRMEVPAGDMLPAFLRLNGELRRINADAIASFTKRTSPTKLWTDPFVPLGNAKVEASFADHRTYFYKGKEVDQQVHLGFDLAVTEHVPVVAANDGTVLNASWIGIYGNCVIVDHGMGVQSLYGHLMSFDVKVGDHVLRGQTIGRSDSTGLAGGDHLHFTMLVGGRMVNPVEWWDPHWVRDRVERKLREASGSGDRAETRPRGRI